MSVNMSVKIWKSENELKCNFEGMKMCGNVKMWVFKCECENMLKCENEGMRMCQVWKWKY